MRATAKPGDPPPPPVRPGPRATRPARGASYFLREGMQGFRRNGLMSLAAAIITMVTLVALGMALVIASTLDHIASSVERRVEVVVYLHDGLHARDVDDLRARLLELPGVTGATYVSKSEALAEFQQAFKGAVDLQGLLSHNPLPASFVAAVDQPARLQAVARAASAFPQVERASYGTQAVDRLLGVTKVVRVGGAIVAGLLALVAMIIIVSTVRLTVFARRTEIEVMRLVGATSWFIRWPLVVEGALTGAVGAFAAVLLVAGMYAWLVVGAGASLPFLPLPSAEQVALTVTWKLLLWGVLIGTGGSLLAVRRYLSL
jgi:cell division transport system permease protein